MPYSSWVELKTGKGSYKGTYGNALPNTFFGSAYTAKYVVKVSTSFTPAMVAAKATCCGSASFTNFTSTSKLQSVEVEH